MISSEAKQISSLLTSKEVRAYYPNTSPKSLREIAPSNDEIVAFAREYKEIFLENLSEEQQTNKLEALLVKWNVTPEKAPTVITLLQFAIHKFDIKKPNYLSAINMAGALAQLQNEQPYHGNLHFKKVVLQTIRLIEEHNRLTAKSVGLFFTERDIVILLIAATIHDLGHDGKGNVAQGMPYPGRLELRSYSIAVKCLEKCGLSEPKDLKDLKVMLLCTDVSSTAIHKSYCFQMKEVYLYFNGGKESGQNKPEISPAIKKLLSDEKLTLLSLMLHEADIATSAGVTYEITKYESKLLAEETGIREIATPAGLLNFIMQICDQQMLSNAARKLYKVNMKAIYKQAKEDFKNGNEVFE